MPDNIIPTGSINFTEFPEKILLQGKKYPIQIVLKNKSENKDSPVDYYLKYRTNGFKILDLPDNLKSEVWFSMPYGLEFPFNLNIEPTIEGPLQFELSMFGKKVTFSKVEKTRKIEVEVEKELIPEAGEVPVTKKVVEVREEKYLEDKIDTEEVLIDSKAIYMEAINAGESKNLEEFMILGDVSSNIEQIKASTVIFYFPVVKRPEYKDLLRNINKQMFETSGDSFFYLNFPITQNMSEAELNSIKEGINKFLPRIKHLDLKLIFNLDFFPKSEKPTIILGKDKKNRAQELYNFLLNKLDVKKYNVILDLNIFNEGLLYEKVNELCSTEDVDIINLVLSDHFREDYSLFINFLNIFSK
ncbi:MAG: hypothetical protein ACFFCM_06720 [Promethearchaeota archaeon]